MPLVHKTIRIDLPPVAPYDTEYYLETFAGEFILPIQHLLERFWFTRYKIPGERYVLFRFSTNDFEQLVPHFELICTRFGSMGCDEYDFVSDLGAPRFLGSNARNQSQRERAELIYDFLTTAAKLLLASLIRNRDGRWQHETETSTGQNLQTSLESVHHLLCNMTMIPTVALFCNPSRETPFLMSPLYASYYLQEHPECPHVTVQIRY